MNIDDWMRMGKYLPRFMRDFHDQKRLFRAIGELVSDTQQKDIGTVRSIVTSLLPHWSDAHIYVVDFFLWYMAKRGYTLQRSRQRLPFLDLDEDLKEFDKRQLERMKVLLAEHRAESARV